MGYQLGVNCQPAIQTFSKIIYPQPGSSGLPARYPPPLQLDPFILLLAILFLFLFPHFPALCLKDLVLHIIHPKFYHLNLLTYPPSENSGLICSAIHLFIFLDFSSQDSSTKFKNINTPSALPLQILYSMQTSDLGWHRQVTASENIFQDCHLYPEKCQSSGYFLTLLAETMSPGKSSSMSKQPMPFGGE